MSDENGRFVLVSVQSGLHVLKVQAVGFDAILDTVLVPAGGRVERELWLRNGVKARHEDAYEDIKDSLMVIHRWPMRLDSALAARIRTSSRMRAFRVAVALRPLPDSLQFFPGSCILGTPTAIPIAWRDTLAAALDQATDFAEFAAGHTLLAADPDQAMVSGEFAVGEGYLRYLRECPLGTSVGVQFSGAPDDVELLITYHCEELKVRSAGFPPRTAHFGGGVCSWMRFGRLFFPRGLSTGTSYGCPPYPQGGAVDSLGVH
jgi:hypothetical protein